MLFCSFKSPCWVRTRTSIRIVKSSQDIRGSIFRQTSNRHNSSREEICVVSMKCGPCRDRELTLSGKIGKSKSGLACSPTLGHRSNMACWFASTFCWGGPNCLNAFHSAVGKSMYNTYRVVSICIDLDSVRGDLPLASCQCGHCVDRKRMPWSRLGRSQ